MSELIRQAGKILKDTRIEKGFTQQELGDKLGLNKSTINRYESGEHNLTLETLERVITALGEKVSLIID